MKVTYEKQDMKKKPKPVIILQMIAWMYFFAACALFVINVSGYRITGSDAMLQLGFLFAWLQTYFVGAVAHAVYFYKD